MIINAYAKINLSLDVLEKLPNGYHKVDMIMQAIDLYDVVNVRWFPGEFENECIDGQIFVNDFVKIEIGTNRSFLPTDERNIAVKSAILLIEKYSELKKLHGKLRIDIKKNIPVSAGMAGGSTNAGAVLLALNEIWDLKLSLTELCKLGGQIGSDVPFTILANGALNENLSKDILNDPLAKTAARATGTGSDLETLDLPSYNVFIAKPRLSVSTPKVYQGLKLSDKTKHPNTDEMIKALCAKDFKTIRKNSINVLESYTLKKFFKVKNLKESLAKSFEKGIVLMSGSGPTVFVLLEDSLESTEKMENNYDKFKGRYRETFISRTL